jgi:hypothetical protein
METDVADRAITGVDRERLVRLLSLKSPAGRWAVEHRHAPLLCALGIIDAPDVDYALAAGRRFADPSETRVRALALIEELDRETRAERYQQRRTERYQQRSRSWPRIWAAVRPR